ncbi:lysine biosynthesis protein LysW [Natronoglycomyces albus]|uniref:Lysine biosynthesis protein LysW n=1 Tax=Natronoglycomyces albus TaxID=2811108 RepID=A0A895XMD9_9ACTN|nr:lysine biosynthesis protein LysW [Natronoglycomyces albus]QSB04165.1 lysine biosynthesis protein LysW [Natronoglycomyces albus]
MTTAIAAPECLVCDTDFEVDPAWEKGEIVECESCGQEHEVAEMTAGSARIELAPEVEEDWGE